MDYISDQQEDIVTSDYKYKLINGCAGSRKTDTLIKCAKYDLLKNKRPILILTLVGSVTDEIKTRLEKELNIEISKQGISNHYLGHYKSVPICISNYDAWVHIMLQDCDFLSDNADNFKAKEEYLLSKTQYENLVCYMKNKINVGLLLIDEVQDLNANKMKIINNISLTDKNLDIYCAGDLLQTIFKYPSSNEDSHQDTSSNMYHPMNIFKRVEPRCFQLNICKRCPKAHVDFNNAILENIQKNYNIPPMLSDNENNIDKPVLFTHYPTSDNTNTNTNTNSMIIDKQVKTMIKTLLNKDDSITPGDIAIIMAKTRNNNIYIKLLFILNKFYKKRGWADSVLHMTTEGDGVHNPLDWNKATGKTIMLSIHGDKGRGHKVVFFLGLSEGSIPRAEYIDKPSEIIAESLLNVGLTRSIKYLFIGFTHNSPSRYLKRIMLMFKLPKLAYLSWKDNEETPEPYKSIILSLNKKSSSVIPNCYKKHYNGKKISGINSTLQVKDNISKDFQIEDLVEFNWKKKESVIKFGKKQEIYTPLEQDHFIILGVMTELLIQRKIKKEHLFNLLEQSNNQQNNIYTDNEKLLNCMIDIKYNQYDLEEYFSKGFFVHNPDLVEDIKNAKNKNVIHSIFRSIEFQEDLESFLSDVVNKDLKTKSIWNLALFYIQNTHHIYRPSINYFLDYLNEDISTLHDNIDIFINNYLIQVNLDFEKPMILKGQLTPKDMIILQTNDRNLSIVGRCDIYDRINKNLYEIKASRIQGCSPQWLTQTVVYAMMLDVYNLPVKNIYIANLLGGYLSSWDVENLSKIEDVISKIGKNYEWHNLESRAMIKGIKQTRELN